MVNDFKEKMLDVKIEHTRNKLISEIKMLRKTLDISLDTLSSDKYNYVNHLGIVQMSGQKIDNLCGRLGALLEIKELNE